MIQSPHSILKEKSKSFFLAGQLLPELVLNDAARLYAYCRRTDDLIDIKGDQSGIKKEIKALEEGKTEISDLIARYDIPLPVMESYLQALLSDLSPVRITSRNGLLRFCYGVAGTVGIMMSHILGRSDRLSLYHAIDLGIGMQLTNIARDRAEDEAADKIYFPQEMDQVDLVNLAEPYYRSGFAGIRLLPFRVRPAIMTAGKVYRAIGEKIKRDPQNARNSRVYVTKPEKIILMAQSTGRVLWPKDPPAQHDRSLHRALEGLPLVHESKTDSEEIEQENHLTGKAGAAPKGPS